MCGINSQGEKSFSWMVYSRISRICDILRFLFYFVGGKREMITVLKCRRRVFVFQDGFLTFRWSVWKRTKDVYTGCTKFNETICKSPFDSCLNNLKTFGKVYPSYSNAGWHFCMNSFVQDLHQNLHFQSTLMNNHSNSSSLKQHTLLINFHPIASFQCLLQWCTIKGFTREDYP